MLDYYDRQGNPLTMWEWAEKFEDLDYKIVQQDKFNGVLVSTVWLGLNHNWGQGKPLIFETMVFTEGMAEEYQERYCTEEEARKGHRKALRWAKKRHVWFLAKGIMTRYKEALRKLGE